MIRYNISKLTLRCHENAIREREIGVMPGSCHIS